MTNPEDIGRTFTGALDGPPAKRGFVSVKAYHDPTPNDPQRLYTDDSGRIWLEVDQADIVAQVDMIANPTDLRSILYIDEDATIRKVSSCDAREVSASASVDPTGAGSGHPPWR